METKRRREDWLIGRADNSKLEENKRHWKRLWSLKVSGKLKNFVWRHARNSIPTEAVWHHQKMSETSVCPLSNSVEDTWKHALIECTMAKCAWSHVDEDLVEHLIACRHDDAKLWLIEIQDSMEHGSFVKMLVTLWSISGGQGEGLYMRININRHSQRTLLFRTIFLV